MTLNIKKSPLIFVLVLAASVVMFLPAAASARTTRPFEGSIGSFGTTSNAGPKHLAVDQASGDVYGFGNGTVSRFTTAGAPKNFTAGPGAGTNKLSDFGAGGSIAIDNSGGPLNGTVYVIQKDSKTSSVLAFASSGASLGVIDGSGTGEGLFLGNTRSACGVAVDQSNGSVYIARTTDASSTSGSKIWRYAPSSPSGAITDADYTVTGINADACGGVAAASGNVYGASNDASAGIPLTRYATSDFALSPTNPLGSQIASGVTAVAVDPKTGDVYADKGHLVSVFDSSGAQLYEFGAAAYFGNGSTGIAVKSAASGPASKAYVADPQEGGHAIDAFGLPTQVSNYIYPATAAFGPDGTSSSSFNIGNPKRLAFDQSVRRLYAIDDSSPGIYGFGASAPPAFPLLGAFDPLATAAVGGNPGLAVDNTALSSSGNVYFTSSSTDLLYGFDDAGAPLSGFPVDPATSPGPPNGSPKDLCAAAVDSGGSVWVTNRSTKRILEYSSTGASLPGAVDASVQGNPCSLAFDTNDDLYVGTSTGVWKYTAASGYATATQISAVTPGTGGTSIALAVDPSTHHLYTTQISGCSNCNIGTWADEYDAAGKLIGEFATDISGASLQGVAVDSTNHHVYLADSGNKKLRSFAPGVLLSEVKAKPASALANTTATLNGGVVTQGLSLSDCHFEYVSLSAFRIGGFGDLSSGGSVPCSPAAGSIPLDLNEHAVSASVSGLGENTEYRFRLLATNANGTTTTGAASFITAGPAQVETTGTPLRTTTSAQLLGRVYPVHAATTYHFEYGTEGPCDANPCAATPDRPAGSGDLFQLVAEEIAGLTPDTTYHYRVIADNGNPEGAAVGEDMTVTTLASEAPLSHGDFSGPPGSDRAYEMVSMPETSGNPVAKGIAFSDDGDRALYGIAGGTPIGETGSLFSLYFAERHEDSPHQGTWETKPILPPRDELVGASWKQPRGRDDLDTFVSTNDNGADLAAIWRLTPAAQPSKLFEPIAPQKIPDPTGGYVGVSGDGSTVVARLQGGTLDPAYPAAAPTPNLYEIGSGGAPELIGLLPGGSVPACGAAGGASQQTNWISADGSLVFFNSQGNACSGPTGLYLRDRDANETKLVSGPALSGPTCGGQLIEALPDLAFFATPARLGIEDSTPANCNSDTNDVYRYEVLTGALECLTCFAEGLDADVASGLSIVVSEDSSHLYFVSSAHLLPGTPPEGQPGAYRLEVASGELAYLAPLASLVDVALTPDGARLFFASSSAALNPLGDGSDNGETRQFYRYDDRDRSIVCVSCPADGALPLAGLTSEVGGLNDVGKDAESPNTSNLSDDGIYAFNTSTPLVGADQNTSGPGEDPQSGQDVYEWRDGRLLLVTDGLTNWFAKDGLSTSPSVQAVSPSGRDVFFTAWDRLTPDAPDSFNRLYTARIGGGFEFAPPVPPCPLEVCQGTPKGAPEESPPGTSAFVGPGNATATPPARCRKGKVRRKGRCVARKPARKRKHQNRANHDRRVGR